MLGREFAYELLQAVASTDETTLQEGLAQLVDAEVLYQRGRPPQAHYVFKHALIQDAAYQSLLRSTRQRVHQQIALALETHFPETVEIQSELLAHHYTEAGRGEQALSYWDKAGQYAIEHSAYQEARDHCARGLEILETLPETSSHLQQELRLQTLLISALYPLDPAGPAIERVYNRAWQLCQQIDEPTQVFPVLRGLHMFYNVRAQYHTAYEVGQRLLRLAQQLDDPARLLEAYRALGTTTLSRGDIADAAQYLEYGITLYKSHLQDTQLTGQYAGGDPGVACFIYGADALWSLGYVDQAQGRLNQGLTLAQTRSYPFPLAWALYWAARVAQCRREVQTTLERAEAALVLCEEHGFVQYVPLTTFLRTWALTTQDHCTVPVAQMYQQLSAHEATGIKVNRGYVGILFAEVLSIVGQEEQALTMLAGALTHREASGLTIC